MRMEMRRFCRIPSITMKLASGSVAATLLFASACESNENSQKSPPRPVASAPPARQDTSRVVADSMEAGGDVLSDSVNRRPASPAGRWITDANVLSMLTMMNAKQIAAAKLELSAWHTDTVRAFAATIAAGHAELQHSVDSVAQIIKLEPIAPALSASISDTMQVQIDSLYGLHGGALDRGFLRQQTQSQAMLVDYVAKLAGVAEAPELQALLSSAATQVASQLSRARALQTAFATADSTALADSLARRAARDSARAARDSARAAREAARRKRPTNER